MRPLLVFFCCVFMLTTVAHSNGETGVLIQPADVGEIEKLLDLKASPPIGICQEDYSRAYWLLLNGFNVYLENTNDNSLIPIYIYKFVMRISERQILFPMVCHP